MKHWQAYGSFPVQRGALAGGAVLSHWPGWVPPQEETADITLPQGWAAVRSSSLRPQLPTTEEKHRRAGASGLTRRHTQFFLGVD